MGMGAIPGPVGQVWRIVMQALGYFSDNYSAISPTESLIISTRDTLKNCLDWVNGYSYQQTFLLLSSLLDQFVALPISANNYDISYLTNRAQALATASADLASLLPSLPVYVNTEDLSNGNPLLPVTDLVSFWMNFSYETVPVNLLPSYWGLAQQSQKLSFSYAVSEFDSLGNTNNPQIQFCLRSFSEAVQLVYEIQNYMDTGSFITESVTQVPIAVTDGVTTKFIVVPTTDSSVVETLYLDTNGTITPVSASLWESISQGVMFYTAPVAGSTLLWSGEQFIDGASYWNRLIVLPQTLKAASLFINDPTSEYAQKLAIIRYNIIQQLTNLNQLLLTIKAQTPSKIATAVVPNGKTLMDISAQKLGDYSRWQEIAALNNLEPPYIGTGQNLVSPGQQIFLPTTTNPVVSISPQTPNYLINYLGVDMYLGPMGQDMLSWTGDFQTIGGYANLSMSLGRRLQTTLGSLIYHTSYGSRIPPEVGNIQSTSTAGHIGAYAERAILADPRVYKVINSTVTVQSNGFIGYTGTAIPNGQTNSGITLNEVLQP